MSTKDPMTVLRNLCTTLMTVKIGGEPEFQQYERNPDIWAAYIERVCEEALASIEGAAIQPAGEAVQLTDHEIYAWAEGYQFTYKGNPHKMTFSRPRFIEAVRTILSHSQAHASPVSAPVPEAKAEQVGEPTAGIGQMKDWLALIYDNGYALGDRLQRLSNSIRLVLGGADPGKHAIREQAQSEPEAKKVELCTTCNGAGSVGRAPDDYFFCPDCTPKQPAAPAVKHEASDIRREITSCKNDVWTAGDDFTSSDKLPCAGIHVGAHGNAIEFHASTLEEAQKRRDSVLAARATPSIAVPAAGSIGDDAKFNDLLGDWSYSSYMQEGDTLKAYADLVAYIDARSPVAAAPEVPDMIQILRNKCGFSETGIQWYKSGYAVNIEPAFINAIFKAGQEYAATAPSTRDATLEEAAKVCEETELLFDIEVLRGKSKLGVSGVTALMLADAIRALKSATAASSGEKELGE